MPSNTYAHMPYNPTRHHRRSIRLKGYDYAQPGAYFVTIRTHGGKKPLSHIVERQVMLTRIGQIVGTCWESIPTHFPITGIDEFVIMPDHLHGLVVIRECLDDLSTPRHDEPRGTIPRSLPAIIQNFKSVSTRRVNSLRGTLGARLWQEDYYEHIVRSCAALERIQRYIVTNPIRWKS